MQSWCKIWPLNEYNLIRAKRKLLWKRKGDHESFSSRQRSHKSFVQATLWNLAMPVKKYHGITVHQRLTDLRRMVLLKERYAELKKERLCCCKSGPNERWWADSMECYCYPRNVQHLQSDWKTPRERRLGERFKGPVIPFVR